MLGKQEVEIDRITNVTEQDNGVASNQQTGQTALRSAAKDRGDVFLHDLDQFSSSSFITSPTSRVVPTANHATARFRTVSRMEMSSFTCGGWNKPSGPCGLTSV